MLEKFRSFRGTMLVSVLIFLALGLVMVIWPEELMNMACSVIGGVLTGAGVILILKELIGKSRSIVSIVLGAVVAALGIMIITSTDLVFSLLPIVFGIILLIDGLINVRHALGIRRYDEPWLSMLAAGALTLALGVLILLHPYGTAKLAFRIMGAAFIYNALSDLFIFFKLHRASRRYVGADGKEHDIIDVTARPVEDDDE